MAKTVALRKQLQALLKTVTANVHYEIASESAPYPYLVYGLRELAYDYGKTLMDLEVNILDYGTSTAVVEALADELQKALNKYKFINHEIQFSVYLSTRNTVEEEDKKIRRRRLTFEVQLHGLEEE